MRAGPRSIRPRRPSSPPAWSATTSIVALSTSRPASSKTRRASIARMPWVETRASRNERACQMLVGFALLTVGMALLGYLVVAREPAAAAARSKSSPLRSPGVPPAPSAEDVSDVAPTLVMRARAATDGASREPRPEPENRPLPTTKSAPSRAMKVVVTYELEDDAETEVYTASKRPSPSAPAGLCLRAAGDTDRGQRRRANDDSLLVSRHHEVFAVADGMGGYAGGSVASSLA